MIPNIERNRRELAENGRARARALLSLKALISNTRAGFCHKGWVSELNYCMCAACSLESIMAELNRFPESAIDSPKRSTNQN